MARSLQERLAALQNSVRPAPVPVVSSQPESGTGAAAEGTGGNRTMADPASQGQMQVYPLERLGFRQYDVDGVGCWYRELRYDLLSRHGNHRFADILSANLRSLAKLGKTPEFDARTLRFYDTETTGLGSGAGTFPFLHAVAQLEEDELVLYQYFLDDYSEEPYLLHLLLRRHFGEGTTVVSFNGKSFDWPLLQSRLNMYRIAAAAPAHIDLLYPSRRLWRTQLDSVSLSSVEAHLLGLQRTDDLPGKEAPHRYFAYVEERNPDLVEPVLDHNASDVCSLVVLASFIANIADGKQPIATSAEYLALGRYYDEWQEHDLAGRCYTAATDCPDADWKAYWLHSLYCKRRQDWDEAVQLWQDMAERYKWSLQPVIELAKYCEHRSREYEHARVWTEQALSRALFNYRQKLREKGLEAMTDQIQSGVEADPVLAALRHRLQRIERKQRLEKAGCDR